MPARTRDAGRASSSNVSSSNSRTGHYGRSSNGRRPRSTVQEEEEEPQSRRRRIEESSNGRRHTEESQDDVEGEEEEEEEEEEGGREEEGGDNDDSDGEANATGLKPREKLPVSEAIKNLVKEMDAEAKDDLKRKANDLVRLALFSELRRTPLRRSDISAKVFEKENSRIFPVVFNRAQKILRSSFGYEMVELRARGTDNEQIMLAQTQTQRRRDTEKDDEKDAKVKGISSKSYVLVSVLPNKLISRITQPNLTLEGVTDFTVGGSRGNESGTEGVLLDWKRSSADLGKTGLTMLILSLVLVNNRVMPEDQLRSYLRRMGLKGVLPESLQSYPELSSGSLAGRDSEGIMLDDFLSNLVKQDYLERTRVQTAAATTAASMDASMARRRTQARGNVKRTRNGDSDIVEDFEFRWGSRAEAEIGEMAAASFIADICLKTNNAGIEEEAEDQEEGETQNDAGNRRERQKKRREQILREVQRAAGSSLVV